MRLSQCSGSSYFILWLLSLLTSISAQGSLRNITVDDSDVSITYEGPWLVDTNNLAGNGSLHFTQNENATAKFSFTGELYLLTPMYILTCSSSLTYVSFLIARHRLVLPLPDLLIPYARASMGISVMNDGSCFVNFMDTFFQPTKSDDADGAFSPTIPDDPFSKETGQSRVV
ncbi:hypothetical protein D9758_016528 [Tetrapyrgos nigripes]|uniref:Uncharacterized protein n=1 Tax=Tetrapyrgos nigripes TaxID=182062 RepID=A0A8H5CKZ6_9AGAR|nr:hypothetical protein D9758_016528 [Tetrapyrgos nigripes]